MQRVKWRPNLWADRSLCRWIVQLDDARGPHVSDGRGHKDGRGADRVRARAVRDVVDPGAVLELDEPVVLAGVPVVGARPALLPAVLPLHHPPVAGHLVGKVCQFLDKNREALK